MKRPRIARPPAGAWALALLLALLLPLRAQKDFKQDERAMIEKYKRARVHFLKGAEHLKKGKLEKARKEAAACLEIFPNHADGHWLSAQILYQQGKHEEALKEMETAKSDFAAFAKFYTYSYQEYLDQLRKDREEQEKYINDLAASLSNARTPEARSRAESQVNQAKQALATIDNRLRNPIPPTMDIPAEYHFIHGNILFKLKRFGEARDFYLAAVGADPRHAAAYNNLINIFFASGDVASARKYLQQAEANGVEVHEGLKKAVLEKK
ncbi:MAG: tetratricopeptide repeat protein [Candidatus Aminicenantes bacterium]|nr:tetratricopeptide repeat protein [Candidatus Aminicenantes bacterium]